MHGFNENRCLLLSPPHLCNVDASADTVCNRPQVFDFVDGLAEVDGHFSGFNRLQAEGMAGSGLTDIATIHTLDDQEAKRLQIG